MKDFFADSYSAAMEGLDPQSLERRFIVLETYCDRESFDVRELVKMYYCLPVSETFLNEFVSLFRDEDMTFSKENKQELSILAGVVLFHLMDTEDDQYFVVFSILALANYGIDIPYPRLIDIAYNTLETLSKETRETAQSGAQTVPNKIVNSVASIKDKAVLDAAGITAIYNAFNSVATSIKAIVKNQESTEYAMEIYREESSILSWLFGSWSNDLSTKLHKKKSQKEVALILAKELADLVNVLPGPYSFRSFLDKMLSNCKLDTDKVSMVEIVDVASGDLKKNIIDCYKAESTIPETTPLLFAIKSSLESGTPAVWQHAVNKKYNLDLCNTRKTILDWCVQMYYECMLVKSSDER